MVIEECAELQKAVCKIHRDDGHITEAHDENLREELVDVLVVCQQMFLALKKVQEISFFINQLDSFQERIVMQMRYLYFENWQDIALRLNYSEPAVYKIHGKALMHLIDVNNAMKDKGKGLF